MDERYFSLALGLLFIGAFFFLKGRKIGGADRLPLVKDPSGAERRKIRGYFAVLAVLTLAMTSAVVVWGVVADKP